MQDFNKKSGVSLVALIITVIVLSILVSITIVSLGDNLDQTKLSNFVNEISKVQDAVDSYYIVNNSLPVLEGELTLDAVMELVNDKYLTDFQEEINLNKDYTSTFYKIDINLLEVKYLDLTDKKNRAYVVSYPNLNVYSLYATKVSDIGYFSLTSKVSNVVEYNENRINSNSQTNITNGVLLRVNSNTSTYANKLGIEINISSLDIGTDEVYLEMSGISAQKKVNSSVANSFSFNTLEELVLNSMLADTLSNTEIETFNNSSVKSINVVIKRNGNEIARENLDMSNYDVTKPIIFLQENNEYQNMIVSRINTLDTNSGIKEIRYDYLKKKDSSGNIVNYYEGVASFDATYLKTKSKVISYDNIMNGIVDIKIPIDVVTVCVVAIDNAGNISDILNIDI